MHGRSRTRYDIRPSHPYNAGTENARLSCGASPLRPAVFDDNHHRSTSSKQAVNDGIAPNTPYRQMTQKKGSTKRNQPVIVDDCVQPVGDAEHGAVSELLSHGRLQRKTHQQPPTGQEGRATEGDGSSDKRLLRTVPLKNKSIPLCP